MFTNHQFKRYHATSNSIFSNPNISWKIRPINGFEKNLFPNTQLVPKHRRNIKIDPARFIYPRDAMGDILHRKTNKIIRSFYLPNYRLVQTRSPAWTIKNIYASKRISHQIGPMTYNSVNDKSQLPCKFGWTQTSRQPFYVQIGLTVPFYDTRKYKAVGNSHSIGTYIRGRASHKKSHHIISKKKNVDKDVKNHPSIAKKSSSSTDVAVNN